MKITKLTSTRFLPVTAYAYNTKGSDKMHFNIRHGGASRDLHMYTFGVDNALGKPNGKDDTKILDDDNYVILPIYTNGRPKKDMVGNQMYYISTDHVVEHKDDQLILWEIPNRFYTDVEYTCSGDVAVIGSGKVGKVRDNESYISPAPVLEVYGNCELSWKAVDRKKHKYEQIFKFDGDKWSIGQITRI